MAEENEVEKTFKELGLRDELVEACENLGWKTPSKIQAEVIPHALEGKDMIGLAQTGSGKTGAFALPILQALLEIAENQRTVPAFFACVLSPTRELAIQIAEQFEALGSGISLKCVVLVGGIDMMQQTLALAKRPHIVVATPGRLMDHLTNTKGFSLGTLRYLVLDEADRLLNEEFEKSLDEILNVIPQARKTYLFSATMTKKVRKLERACLKNPVKIEASSKYSTVDTLKQQYRFVPAKYKKRQFHSQPGLTRIANRTSSCQATRVMASSVAGTKVGYSTLSVPTSEPVVSVDWLHANLREPDLKVLDASWYMLDEQRNPIQEYQVLTMNSFSMFFNLIIREVVHIPGALFFDVDGISDRKTNLPHMLPSEEAFAAAVSALGIQKEWLFMMGRGSLVRLMFGGCSEFLGMTESGC